MTDEKALLDRLRLDDASALEEIMEAFTPYVFSVLSRNLGQLRAPEDLEELASNVFYALWRHRRRLKTDHLRGWLSKVAANEARSFLRRRKPDTLPMEDYLNLPQEDVQRLAEAEERARILRQALGSLAPSDREIFFRYYAREQTVSEIAAQMGWKLPTVKSRLQRGREKLKQILTEGGYHLED